MTARIVALLFLSCLAYAGEPAKLSIVELLQPERRLHALQQYCLETQPDQSKLYEWSDLNKFAQWHGGLSVSKLLHKGSAPTYLVTWHPLADAAPQNALETVAVLVPQEILYYQLFSSDGKPLKKEDEALNSIVADLNGDGELEVVKQIVAGEEGGVPDILGSAKSGEIEIELLQVHPLGPAGKPALSIVFNSNPKQSAAVNRWGFQARSNAGIYQIELGPVLSGKNIEPRVIFRWNGTAWVGQKSQLGDHFRVLAGKEPLEEAKEIALKGGLGYPLIEDAKPLVVDESAKQVRPVTPISITNLFRPETRTQTLQQFCMNEAAPQPGEALQWGDPKSFGIYHNGITVSELRHGNDPSRYLVTWFAGVDEEEEWNQVDSGFFPVTSNPAVLLPRHAETYRIFSSDGMPLSKEECVYDGIVADLNGDGELDSITREVSNGRDAVSGLNNTKEPKMAFEFLEVRAPVSVGAVSLAILYNTHPNERAVGNTWGFQVREIGKDGLYEIDLGPVLAPEGIEAKITFHWDRPTQAWIGPPSKAGDHFRVITSDTPLEEAQRIASAGGLGYPLVPVAIWPAAKAPDFAHDVRSIAPELLSKPYSYHSLAKLSNEELFAFMAENRSVYDYAVDQIREATAVPDFWSLDPKAAALACVTNNRPPGTRPWYLLSVFNPGNEIAPVEGDITLSDGPSGCGAVGGTYLHHLHCAREGSCFAYLETVNFTGRILPTEQGLRFDFRKLDLPYEEARHILQTAWYLSRIRSRQVVAGNGGQYFSGGSTSDGFASVHMAAGKLDFTVSGTRAAPYRAGFMGAGAMSESYDTSAFINLVVQLFQSEMPAHLGKTWESQAIPLRYETREVSSLPAPAPHTADDLQKLEAAAANFLQLYREHKLPAAAAVQAISAAGEMGWSDLRAQIAELSTLVPPPGKYETQLAEIDAKLEKWKKNLGAGVDQQAYSDRERRRSFAATPTADSGWKLKALNPIEAAAFAEVDMLFATRQQAVMAASEPDRDIARLRESIPQALDQLDYFNDAEELFRRATQQSPPASYYLPWLVKLDSNLAVELLKRCEEKAESIEFKRFLAAARQGLTQKAPAAKTTRPRLPSKKERAALIETLLDAKASSTDRSQALDELVPSENPTRYSDAAINAALLELFRRTPSPGESGIPYKIPEAIAHRLGRTAWDVLTSGEKSRWHCLADVISGLEIVADREPKLYRAKLRDLLASELKTPTGDLNPVLWCAWRLDLRELNVRPCATGGPLDYESTDRLAAHSDGRYHNARRIAALWDEEDPLTRARLMVALAVFQSRAFTDPQTDTLKYLCKQLTLLRPTFAKGEQAALTNFVSWCESYEADLFAKNGASYDDSQVGAVIKAIRVALHPPKS